MIRLQKFLRLDRESQRLVLRSVMVLAAVRIGLSFLRFRTVDDLVTRRARRRATLVSRRNHSAERIAWAVSAVSRYVPGATCLPQALAAHFLLTRHGHRSLIRLGVTTKGTETLTGHAWVETDGAVFLQGDNPSRYIQLPFPDAEPVVLLSRGAGR